MKKNPFGTCCVCGQIVYIDGFGDDVISRGYETDDGWHCEGCISNYDIDETLPDEFYPERDEER